jgi:rod shape-determining protein MreD
VRSIALSSSRNRPRRNFAAYAGPQWHVVALWLLLALVLQATLVHYLAFRGVAPSLVLVVVVWFSIRLGPRRAAVYGLIAGICEDVLAAQTGAAWTISTTLTATLTSLLSRGFFADSIPLVSAVMAIATLLRALLFWIVMSLEGYPAGLAGLHFHQALWQALFNAAVMALSMLAARRFEAERA